MKFNFVYSAGGGAGDWNGINRVWLDHMPEYFKDNLLIKFGDIFFNHRSNSKLIKHQKWNEIDNARTWLFDKTCDDSIYKTNNLILDVGTSKIVSWITHHNSTANGLGIIKKFDELLDQHNILDKYCKIITESNITNAVTFDIPNLFKVRTQAGNIDRNLFHEEGCKSELIKLSAKYANYTYHNINQDANSLMTIISAHWSNRDISEYFNLLDYKPTKLAIGGLTDYKLSDFSEMLSRLNTLLNLSSYNKVHFLGSGGIKKSNKIIETLGNHDNFSVDNTTAYNRSIDGNTRGTSFSGYYDYITKKLYRIKNDETKDAILKMHSMSPKETVYFSVSELEEIIDYILLHQSGNSSYSTYDNRAKLIIHNFDVYRFNVE